MANELVVYWIICSTDLGQEGGLGLIINFASSLLICELDDILVSTARVHNLKERFDNIEETDLVDEHEEAQREKDEVSDKKVGSALTN
jgi:hypothetical protein